MAPEFERVPKPFEDNGTIRTDVRAMHISRASVKGPVREIVVLDEEIKSRQRNGQKAKTFPEVWIA
jgi:hypothetical protein